MYFTGVANQSSIEQNGVAVNLEHRCFTSGYGVGQLIYVTPATNS